MAVSPGLAYSLARGVTQEQYDQNLLDAIRQGEAQGFTDAQFRSQMVQSGISAEDVARVTQATPQVITDRFNAAIPRTQAEIDFDRAAMGELGVRQGQNQTQIADNQRLFEEEQRLNELANQRQIAENLQLSNEQQRLNELANQQQIAANQAASQRQIAENQTAYEAYLANQQRIAAEQAGAAPGGGPFANATQGFAQNFANFQSIPIGAQFNPGVTAGGMSPYSQIMGQMRPLGNPYATAQSGLPMGGYDPGIYNPNLLSNFVAERAANVAANVAATAGSGSIDGGSGGDVGVGDTGFDDGGFTAANPSDFGAVDDGGFTAADPADFGGYFKGGLITQVFGSDPAGPDEGQVSVQKGEYVVRKSSVKKYGQGLLDMINDGKIPAKKIRSLLD